MFCGSRCLRGLWRSRPASLVLHFVIPAQTRQSTNSGSWLDRRRRLLPSPTCDHSTLPPTRRWGGALSALRPPTAAHGLADGLCMPHAGGERRHAASPGGSRGTRGGLHGLLFRQFHGECVWMLTDLSGLLQFGLLRFPCLFSQDLGSCGAGSRAGRARGPQPGGRPGRGDCHAGSALEEGA